MNIAILGGKFDPPHNGHLLVAQQILEKLDYIDQVWLIPANTHPWKKMNANALARLAMTKLLVNKNIKTRNIDISRGGNTYTIDTVNHLQKHYRHQFYWIIGSDNLIDFNKWKDWQQLQNKIKFIVFKRAGYKLNKLPVKAIVIDGKDIMINNYSSEIIRGRIAKGLPITGLVPEKVEKYIIKNRLYLRSKSNSKIKIRNSKQIQIFKTIF